MIASRQQGQRGGYVLMVHRAVDDRVSQARQRRHLFSALKALACRQTKHLCSTLAPKGAWVSYANDLEFVGVLLRV